MDTLMMFVKSDMGILIAWIFGIVGFFISVIQFMENKKLKNEIVILKNINMKISDEKVIQSGDKNVYTKNNSGGMNINM